MSDEIERPDWQDDAPGRKPTVNEEGAWTEDWRNAYDAATGAGSRKPNENSSTWNDMADQGYRDGDGRTYWGVSSDPERRGGGGGSDRRSPVQEFGERVIPSDGTNLYRNRNGDVVGDDVRVSGRDADGNIVYNGRPQYSGSGMNMLQSAAAPITAGINTYKNVTSIDSLTDWTGYATLVTGLAGDISAVHGMVKEYYSFVENITNPNFDPVQWLAGTLIDFLIQLFQPLEDLLGLVTGNETRMKESAKMWDTVAVGAPQVGDYIGAVADESLADWIGEDGDAARMRVAEAGEAVRGMGYAAIAMQAILVQMADVAKALRQDVVDLIAKGVSWALTRLLPQAAAAVATFGAWMASMVAQAIAKIASLVVKAVKRVTQVLGIAEKAAKTVATINEIIVKIKPVLDFLRNNRHMINTGARVAEQIGR